MWQAIKIDEQNYFFQCSSDESNIHYHLYNLKEIWSEQCSVSDIIIRAKELNKRISYDSETVLKTIKSTTPTTFTIEATEDGHTLLLKYHIVGRPFNFEWKLKPLPVDDLQKLVTYPLFMSIHYLSVQIKELKDTIKKKDIEIEQFKVEGAVLRRTTVATVPFNEDAFSKRYAKINEMSEGFFDISKKVKSCFPVFDIAESADCVKSKPNSSSSLISTEKLKRSPKKSIKRKFFENRRLRMESLVRAKKEKMEFLSSQSQTPPGDELAEIIQSLDELNAKRLASTTM